METLAQYTAEERDGRTIQVEVTHTFPVPVADAFAYSSAIENWKDYWPDFVRVLDTAQVRPNRPRNRAIVTQVQY
jgi:hypothetical protein